MSDVQDPKAALATAMQEALRRQRMTLFDRMYPEEDQPAPPSMHDSFPEGVIYARHRYPKHMEFFEAGADYLERCAMAANRVGKTFGMGGYETACHLTGLYPSWWVGKRFTRPIRAWAAGKTNETTRDIVQKTLLGDIAGSGSHKGFDGTGVIPGRTLGKFTWKSGVADLADTIKVRHVSGGWSALGLKSYQQGRSSFEGTAQHVIWLDEEPPMDVYGECLIRLATTRGILLLTFTPIEGMSEVVMQYMPKEMRPDTMEEEAEAILKGE